MEKYDPKKIEAKWQKFWAENPQLCAASGDSEKEKKYVLDMWPYPSGDGLHVGHVESYTATDIMSRFYRMNGFNIMHPQGWDAFGLPAENFAIKTGAAPQETTAKAIVTFRGQMDKLGFSYDWSREQNSSDPAYYKWTQWFFLLFYKNGLAFKKKAKVNWCESCQTVLANEQAEGGICERCGNAVIQKDLEQWFFKITDFIENNKKTAGLLQGLDKLDWPESIKASQKNWIGRSEGTLVKFAVILNEAERNEESRTVTGSFAAAQDDNLFIEVFTTRVDTIFGCTYCVVAPEHPVLENLKAQISNFKDVEKYVKESRGKTELERTELQKEKTGVKLEGVTVINPFTKQPVPLFVADYVLGGYGTGAVMAVPAHDERDFAFAKKYDLPIKKVILPPALDIIRTTPCKASVGVPSIDIRVESECFTEDGILINSEKFSELISEQAREKMTAWLEKEKLGAKKVNYRLRDWLVSRQRYWGAPIPIIYCPKCGEVPVPEKDLPVVLPTDVDFKPTGESPLVNSKTFHDVKCPQCGGKARRESDTMDTFVCSSWYYFRYTDPKNEQEFASKENIKKWLPVDLYVGGAEHAVLHLLYARFFTKVLHNLGYVDFDEPFLKLRNQGLIIAEDGKKMSKSLGNVVNPDQVVEQVGADALRMFEMFMGPLEATKPWNTKGIAGVQRFLEKVYKLQEKVLSEKVEVDGAGIIIELEKNIFLFHVRNNQASIASGMISFFGGKRNEGELAEECAVREIKEELGVEIKKEELQFITDYKNKTGNTDRFFMVHKNVVEEKISLGEGEGVITLSLVEALKHENVDERAKKILEIYLNKKIKSILHKTIKKVTEDIENFRFNTSISQMMILVNALEKEESIPVADYQLLLALLSPFAPHIAEEIWQEKLGHKESIFLQQWPQYDEKYLKEEEIEMAVQVNGKLRDRIYVAPDVTEDEAKETALECVKVRTFTEGKEIKKVIFVPGKLINIVIG